MKLKHAIIIYLAGVCLYSIGELFKITHTSQSSFLLIGGTFCKVTGALVIVYKLLKDGRAKKLLNW